MKYTLSHYSQVIPIIKIHTENNLKNKDPSDLLSELSILTSAPIVIVGYILVKLGYTSEKLLKSIDSLEKFYKVEVDQDA